MTVFDLDRRPGDVHPRHAAAPADQVLPARAGEGAGRARADDRGARRDPRRRARCCAGRLRRAGRGRQDLRHPAPHRAARVRRASRSTAAVAARGRRRPVLRLPLLHRPARPHHRRRAARATAAAAPTTTWSSRRCAATARGQVGVLTTAGRLVQLDVLDLPTLPATANDPHLQGGAPVSEFLSLEPGERVLALCTPAGRRPRARARHPRRASSSGSTPRCSARDAWEVIRLDDGDEVVGARRAAHRRRGARASSPPTPSCCTSRPSGVRPQGRVRRRHRRRPARRRRRGRVLRRRRAEHDSARRRDRLRVAARRCPAPSRARSRSPRSPSTPPRAAAPAACAATGSSRARTPRASPGPAPRPARAAAASGRPGRPARRRPAAATAPACRAPSRSPRSPGPVRVRRGAHDTAPDVRASRRPAPARAAPRPGPRSSPAAAATTSGDKASSTPEDARGGQDEARRRPAASSSRWRPTTLPDGVDGLRRARPGIGTHAPAFEGKIDLSVNQRSPSRCRSSRSTAWSTPSCPFTTGFSDDRPGRLRRPRPGAADGPDDGLSVAAHRATTDVKEGDQVRDGAPRC